MKETHVHTEEKVVFGFWLYIMSDCLLFASLFATFAVLRGATYGGPTGYELFSLPFIFWETIILLTSSFTAGLAILAAHERRVEYVLLSLFATLFLGLLFVAMEVREFAHFIAAGHGPQVSAFLSSFFTLVGTHGTHVALGALWMLVLIAHIWRKGLTPSTVRKLMCLSLFWHFLDIVWIFIFTFVYLFSFAL